MSSRVIPLYQRIVVSSGALTPLATPAMLPATTGQFGNSFGSLADPLSGRLVNAASLSEEINLSDPSVGLMTAANLRMNDGAGFLISARTASDGADNQAQLDNQLLAVAARLQALDGTTYDRLRALADNADNQAPLTQGLLAVLSRLQAFDGTNFDRLRALADNADDQAPLTQGLLAVLSRLQAFDGTNFDRLRVQSAANVSAATQAGAVLSAAPGCWSVNHTPAPNTQATITRAAGGAGVRHVCTSISCTLIGLAAAAETTVLVNLRDGATGAGTILWSQRLQVIPGGTTGLALSALQIPGSADTAMTWEFAAAGGADTFESVALTGYDVA